MIRTKKPKPEPQLCDCHCGGLAKPGNKFINGHNARKKPKPIPNHHPCKCDCGILVASDKEYVIGHNRCGKYFTELQSQKLSYAMTNVWANPILREKQSKSQKIAQNKPEVKARSVETATLSWQDPEYRSNVIATHLITENLPEIKERKSRDQIQLWINRPEFHEQMSTLQTKIMTENWQDPEWRKNRILAIGNGMHIFPNNPESLIKLITEEYWQGWKYTGDYSIVINGKNPDFINEETKQIIEVYGDYWHEGEDPTDRAEIFAQAGYETLVIWEHELKDLDRVIWKIKLFMNGGIS